MVLGHGLPRVKQSRISKEAVSVPGAAVVGELLVLGREEVALGDVVAERAGAGPLLGHGPAPCAISYRLGPGCIHHGTRGGGGGGRRSDTSLSDGQSDIKIPRSLSYLFFFHKPIVRYK